MLSLANSINRLNLLFQQSRLQETLQNQGSGPNNAAAALASGQSPMSSLEQGIALRRPHIVTGTPQTVFLADLPKDLSSVELYEFLKSQIGEAEVVIKRPVLKYFYYAFCRFPDIIQARKLTHDIKFPELLGHTCRALPYDKELIRANCPPGSNIFVKGLPSEWTHKELHDAFKHFGEIVSTRVSIKEDYSSRGFGYVAFTSKAAAEKACVEMDGKQLPNKNEHDNDDLEAEAAAVQQLSVKIFVPRSERQPSSPETFTNLFVKNFPPQSESGTPYTEADLKAVFEPYGPITSCKVDDSGAFGFVCFEDSTHAAKALSDLGSDHVHQSSQDENKTEPNSPSLQKQSKLYVARMQNKDVREKLLRIEMLKSMKQMARQNLYFKGFPVDAANTSEKVEQLEVELKEFFTKFGDVKNLKLARQTQSDAITSLLVGVGFVSFQTLEAAQKCRFEASKDLFQDQHKLYVNQFEWKELRQAHKMERIDQIELGRYLRQEKTSQAKVVLDEVKEDLASEQGQLLLRVLKLLTQVYDKQKQERETFEQRSAHRNNRGQGRRAPSGPRQPGSRNRSRTQERAPVAPQNDVEAAQQSAAQHFPAREQAISAQRAIFDNTLIGQSYAVRYQTIITSVAYLEADEAGRKQYLGSFMFDHVRCFIEQAAQVGNHDQNLATQLAPKITGMVMSLPLQTLIVSVSTHGGLFEKVHEAMSLLRSNNMEGVQQQDLQQQMS